ncbi:hypothetical protein OAD50_03230 [Vicingaceae bacterium]|nr:hypothetical protein [Vicingaceae bacterium]
MKNKIKNLIFDSNKGKIKLNERASIFFFCLVLSTFFWFLSSLSKQYTTNLTIPIEYTSFNKDFILTEEPIDFIEIQVSGSGFELLGEQMSLNGNSLKVNLSEALKLGKNRFGIPTSKLQNEIYQYLDKDIRFERMTSDSILFKTDKRVTRSIKVIPDVELSFESSYNLMGEITVNPSMVEISGPQEELDSIQFLTTKKIKYEEVNDSLTITYLLSEDERFQSLDIVPKEVSILVPVDKFTEKSFDLPIEWNNNVSIRTFPKKVKVVFLVPLSNYEQLTEQGIKALVNLTDGFQKKRKLKVEIKGVPDFAILLRIEPEKIEFIIKQ